MPGNRQLIVPVDSYNKSLRIVEQNGSPILKLSRDLMTVHLAYRGVSLFQVKEKCPKPIYDALKRSQRAYNTGALKMVNNHISSNRVFNYKFCSIKAGYCFSADFESWLYSWAISHLYPVGNYLVVESKGSWKKLLIELSEDSSFESNPNFIDPAKGSVWQRDIIELCVALEVYYKDMIFLAANKVENFHDLIIPSPKQYEEMLYYYKVNHLLASEYMTTERHMSCGGIDIYGCGVNMVFSFISLRIMQLIFDLMGDLRLDKLGWKVICIGESGPVLDGPLETLGQARQVVEETLKWYSSISPKVNFSVSQQERVA